MAELSAVRLVIETVGEKEAIAALDKLDATGRRVVERVAQTTSAGLGNIAAAYQKAGAEGQIAFQRVAAQVDVANDRLRIQEREARAAAASVGRAAEGTEALARRQGLATLAASRGLEQIARTGTIAGSALDTVLAQGSQLAFGFGPAGPILGALAVATVAVVGIYRRAAEESKKLAESIAKDFERIANLDVAGQGRAASLLYSGERFSADPLKRQGVQALEAQAAAARARIAAGTSTFTGAYGIQTKEMTGDAREATEQLAKLNAELTRRRDLLASITGPGGSMEYAASIEVSARAAQLATQAEKDLGKAARERLAEAKRLAKEAADYAKGLLSDARLVARTMVAQAKERDSFLKDLLGLPDAEEQKAQMRQLLFEVGVNIREAIANDPFLNAKIALERRIKDLSASVGQMLSSSLGQAIGQGFTAAFSTGSVTAALAAFGTSMLSGLGDLMISLGERFILFGKLMEGFIKAVAEWNPWAQVAAGAAMIAAGAGMKAIARSFGGGGRGASGGTGSYVGSGQSAVPDYLTFGVGASGYTARGSTASPAAARTPVQIGPIIGSADPRVQRDIGDIVERALKRNLIPSLA